MAIKPRNTILTDIISRFVTGILKNITAKKHRDQHTDLTDSMEHILDGARILEGNTALFDWSKGYLGKLRTEALTGDIELNMTGALPGAWSLIRHNDSSIPSINGLPVAQILEIHSLASSYKLNEDNYIHIQCVDNQTNTVVVRILDRKTLGGSSVIPTKIESGTTKVEVTDNSISAVLQNTELIHTNVFSLSSSISLGDFLGGTRFAVNYSPSIVASNQLLGYVNNKWVFKAQDGGSAAKVEVLIGNLFGATWVGVYENGDEILLHAESIKLDKLFALPDASASNKALSLDENGVMQYGPITALASAVTLLLQNGVQNAELQVEIERILSLVGGVGQGLRLLPVADIAARDALTGLVEENRVHIKNDGDGKWAEYRVDAANDGTGANAVWTKLGDQDALFNALTDAAIKESLLNNPNTEDYSTVEKSKVTANTSKVGIPATSTAGVVVNEDTGGGHSVSIKPFVQARLDVLDSADQALITALASAVWANDDTTIVGWAFGRYHFDDDYRYEAVDDSGAIIRVSKKKPEAVVGGSSEFDYDTEFDEYWSARIHNGKTLDVGGKLTTWVGVKGVGTLTPAAAEMDFVDETSHVLVNNETDFSVSGLVTGTQPFTIVKLFHLTGFTGTPTFKHSANSGQTKGKLESGGFKFQESGSSDETLPFSGLATVDENKTYMLIYQRLSNNKYQAHIAAGGSVIYSTAETTMAGGLDLSNLQNIYNDDLEKVKFLGVGYSAFDLTKIGSLYNKLKKEFIF